MAVYKITGGNRLSGEIDIQGAKNSALPILAATVLTGGESVIHNCPNLSDVRVSLKILEHIGCECSVEGNTVTVNSKCIINVDIPDDLMREMRSSVLFLGALAGRMHTVKLSSPGGCELGPRPIDFHINAFGKMGMNVVSEHGFLLCTAKNGIKGANISLIYPSVGATENIILAATLANGITTIHNAAKEPEICDLAEYLISAGARIYGAGTDTVIIHGVTQLHGTEYTVMSDRIVAVTYMSAAAITGGNIHLNKISPVYLTSVINSFKDCGCIVKTGKNAIKIEAKKRLYNLPEIRTGVYPGFPTDAGPPVLAALTLACGNSVFVENVFQNRFKYLAELSRLGADVKSHGNVAVINGVKCLSASTVQCTDLRGGAALVVAALAAEGTTTISKICHIERGYENIESALNSVGANVKKE